MCECDCVHASCGVKDRREKLEEKILMKEVKSIIFATLFSTLF